MGLTNIACFIIGAKVGQAVSKGEKIETPTLNPLKAYRENEEKKKAQEEQDKISVIMSNLEAYNGTSDGQKDVPR
jgi:hypothetical protein